MFAAAAAACRVNVSSLCIFIALWHIIVYCPIAHMVRVHCLHFSVRTSPVCQLACADAQHTCDAKTHRVSASHFVWPWCYLYLKSA